MADPAPGILGLGYQLPRQVRGNDDPLFQWLREHPVPGKDLFQGYGTRHVLAEGETLLDITEQAARKAMADAAVAPGDVDLLLGCLSLSHALVPSDLFALHGRLGLRQDVLSLPLGNDFSNFGSSLVLADAMIRAGRAATVLVAIGGGWSRAMDYRTPWSVSVGDAAAAAVLGWPADAGAWRVVDHEVVAVPANFGNMAMIGDARQAPAPAGDETFAPELQDWTGPYFHINAQGQEEFLSFGGVTAPEAALRLLARQGVAAAEVTLIGHQVSDRLLAQWQTRIRPARLVETLARFGNMTAANIPVNLAAANDTIETPWLLLSLAPDMHAHAVLLRRAAG